MFRLQDKIDRSNHYEAHHILYSVQTFCDEDMVYMIPIVMAYPQIRCSVLFMRFGDALRLMIDADNK